MGFKSLFPVYTLLILWFVVNIYNYSRTSLAAMKSVSVVKASPGSVANRANQPALHKKQHVSQGQGPAETVVASQAEYIDNLQQQIYFLENEIGYLRTHMEESNKLHPSMMVETEKMVKKLGEAQKEIQNLRVDLKRKQTTMDVIKSQKERILRKMEETEAIRTSQKNACLEEMVELRKERDDYLDRNLELERMLQESKQMENRLLEEIDKFRVQVEELKRTVAFEQETIVRLKENITDLNKKLFESELKLEARQSSEKGDVDKLKDLRREIQELHENLKIADQTAGHERILRSRLSEDNAELIKRHADLEGELAEVKTLLREEKSQRSSLETIHLKLVVDASETKSHNVQLKAQVNELEESLRIEIERSHELAMQLSDEQRFKSREEHRVLHLERRLEQREERLRIREQDNSVLQRDNAFMKDQVQMMEQQISERDKEVDTLKQKVQEMQLSVDEFIQNSRTANKLEGQRWKQLTQLAQGIQTLSQKVSGEQVI